MHEAKRGENETIISEKKSGESKVVFSPRQQREASRGLWQQN